MEENFNNLIALNTPFYINKIEESDKINFKAVNKIENNYGEIFFKIDNYSNNDKNERKKNSSFLLEIDSNYLGKKRNSSKAKEIDDLYKDNSDKNFIQKNYFVLFGKKIKKSSKFLESSFAKKKEKAKKKLILSFNRLKKDNLSKTFPLKKDQSPNF